jgi:serine/threonine protein kinase
LTLTPGALLGPYEILTPLGSGGMGEVYRARDRRLDRQVAIKVLPQELTGSSQALERFQREARAASALNHPNICTVHDVGETSDHRQFLVMELLEGETLHDRLLRGAFDITQLLELGTSLVDALAAAHGAGIVHRDIKPANIFLVMRSGGSVVPKILDFGLAKVTADASAAAGATALETRGGSALTDPGSTVGTVAYMSPEQLRGEHLDVRTDLFSLGLVLYEMATGRPAFSGATSAMISAAILDRDPLPPRQLRADLPARLEDVVLKALEKDREIRYQTASDMRADLRRVKRELDSHHGQTPAHVSDAGTVSAVTPALTNTSAAVPHAQPKVESSDAQVVAALVKRHRGGLALAIGAVALALLAGGYYVLQRGDAQSAPEAAPGLASFQNVEITQLTTSGNAAVPAIAPDSKFVAYLQRDESGTSLWIRQTATASPQRIVPSQLGVELHGVTVTPDSNFVDFRRTDSKDPGSLWRVPFLGGSPRKLIDDIAGLPGWSPDGRRMAFVRRPGMLVVADADGGNESVVLAPKAPAPQFNTSVFLRPAWSPDGRVIALVAYDTQGGGIRGLIAFVNAADGSLPSGASPGLTARRSCSAGQEGQDCPSSCGGCHTREGSCRDSPTT